MALQKIPATVVTGFLGAGKTTLIREMLTNANGRRIALIINEFGDVGVDGDILKGCGEELCREEDIVELANGCICCTVADDFVPTMSKLISRQDPPDHIVIETSGLALPQPLVKAFNWPEISTKVTVDGVVTVVDGPAVADGRFAHDHDAVDAQRAADPELDHESPLEELYEDQLACADMIILHKTDLMDEAQISTVSDELKASVPASVSVVKTAQGKIDPSVLLGMHSAAEQDMDRRKSHHEQHGKEDHDHDDFETFVVEFAETGTREELLKRIASTVQRHEILRLKGFAAVAGTPARLLIQAVGSRVNSYFDQPWAETETPRTALVVIGLKGLNAEAVTRDLRGDSN